MRVCYRSVALMVTLLSTDIIADDVDEVTRLSASFESARMAGDLEAAAGLLLPQASSLNALGRDRTSLLDELRGAARRLQQSKGQKLESVRVVQREVAIHGDTAVVTELLGADAGLQDQHVEPERRTIVWARAAGAWKVAHVHSSAYARWEPAIAAYEQFDADMPPPEGGVVFVGSSSIRRWQSLVGDFPETSAIGRGFGGSQLIDSVLYAHRIVTPYRPRAVAVYAGDNDIASGKGAEQVLHDFRLLVGTIHQTLPQARIGFIAIKPSVSRWKRWPEMKRANALVRQWAATHHSIAYLDIATPMLGPGGMPREELFVEDGLHLNEKGYALWTSVIRAWINAAAR